MPKVTPAAIQKSASFYKCAISADISSILGKPLTFINKIIASECKGDWASESPSRKVIFIYFTEKNDFSWMKKKFQGKSWDCPTNNAIDTFQAKYTCKHVKK